MIAVTSNVSESPPSLIVHDAPCFLIGQPMGQVVLDNIYIAVDVFIFIASGRSESTKILKALK